MQPSQPLPSDITTLADWIYKQFKATEPIEVQNILPERYFFRYCVGEEINTPDPVTKQVAERKYEEKWFEPGETAVLMGGAAYIFVDGIARSYVFQKLGADATASVEQLVEAAKLAIVGRVGFASQASAQSAPAAPVRNEQAPTAIATTAPVMNSTPSEPTVPTAPEVPENTGGDKDDDAFGDDPSADDRFQVIPADQSEDGKAHFLVDGKEVSNTEYNEAVNAARA